MAKRENKKKQRILSARNLGKAFLGLVLAFYLFLGLASLNTTSIEQIPLSQALEKIKQGDVGQLTVIDNRIELELKQENKIIYTTKEENISFTQILSDAGIDPLSVNLSVNNQDWTKVLVDVFGMLLPLAFTGFLFWYIFRQAGRAQSSIFSFGKSKAKLFVKGRQDIKFNDVAGLKETKEEMMEVVDFLKNPEKYRKVGARTPKGVLLIGPSGVGKTLLARAVAGEADVPFFSMAGSEFMEILVGVGASRVRDLFLTAKKSAPAIIFIDELDAIGRSRSAGAMPAHDEREQTLNQILVEMDGFEPTDRVVIIAASNRGDLLDPALLRPGRFDRRIVLTLPDLEERKAILKLHSSGKPFIKRLSWEKIARRTVGFSGADLENMLNEAAILTARSRKTAIGLEEIEEAALKVKLGPEKKRLQSKKDREITAYHEAGHALVSFYVPEIDPVERVSIVSRGVALGYTLISPRQDRLQETKTRLLSQITTLLGGRAAEEFQFSEMTTGAASDIEQATKISRKMVTEYGMSSLGPLNFGPSFEQGDSFRSYFSDQEISSQMRSQIDKEIKAIIDLSYKQAQKIVKENKKYLDKIAQKLVEKETLTGEELVTLIKNG
ncbi:MAG: ATP-dependent zinc metalloprotease FtsH [Candidatus Shapirobacteria bacterium]